MIVNDTLKEAKVEKQTVSEADLEAINRYTLRELTAEEVFTFRLAACDNQVDRDGERFSDRTLEELAGLFLGKPVLLDHNWSAKDQTARVYGGHVETDADRSEVKRLILQCYAPRLNSTQRAIEAIETGLRKECSVGCAIKQHLCSICGENYYTNCLHIKGQEYAGKVCHVVLDGAADAYEVSMVAVPAQREAGVVKAHDGKKPGGWTKLARRMMELEQVRYGALSR